MKLLALVASAALLALPVNAQQKCFPTEQLTTTLTEQYNEAPLLMGIMQTGGLLHIWGNRDKGTWMAVVTSPTGMSCAVASGSDLEVIPGEPNA